MVSLKIRTLGEKRCEEALLNSVAADTVRKTGSGVYDGIRSDPAKFPKRMSGSLPQCRFENDVSEQFAVGLLKPGDLGAPVNSAIYLIALTCESADDLCALEKIRAMVVKKSMIVNFPTEVPTFQAERSSDPLADFAVHVHWNTRRTSLAVCGSRSFAKFKPKLDSRTLECTKRGVRYQTTEGRFAMDLCLKAEMRTTNQTKLIGFEELDHARCLIASLALAAVVLSAGAADVCRRTDI